MEISKILLITTCLSMTSAHAKSPDMVFVAPGLESQRCLSAMQSVFERFAKEATRGAALGIYDGKTLEEITKVSVPDTELYEQPNSRRVAKRNGPAVQSIKSFCMHDGASKPTLLFYEALRFAGNNLQSGSAPLDILLVGPPMALDPKAPATSMRRGIAPGDAHLFVSRFESVYGTAREENLLKNVRVHFSTLDDGWAASARHQAAVERFISYSVELRGGEFASFERDIGTVLARINSNSKNRLTYEPLSQTDHKLVMVDYGRVIPGAENIFERPLSTAARPADALIAPLDQVSIGISWECACDADLVVTTAAGRPPLYWNNRQTEDGRFLKDFRTANARRGFETVILSRPVRLGDLMIAVNLYGGDVPQGLTGRVRVAINQETYEAPFVINATTGNRGRGLNALVENGSAPNEYWSVIDALKVVSGERP